jgi:hypothetical protein
MRPTRNKDHWRPGLGQMARNDAPKESTATREGALAGMRESTHFEYDDGVTLSGSVHMTHNYFGSFMTLGLKLLLRPAKFDHLLSLICKPFPILLAL